MLVTLIVALVILWFLGYVRIDGINIPDMTLFSINSHPVTLWNLLILIVVAWALSLLPTPLREIGGVLLILWILSILGIVALGGLALSNLLVIALIAGLIISLFTAAA